MDKLFNDSETFTKERPKDLTEKQTAKFIKDMAEEMLQYHEWGDIETVIEDLGNLSLHSSGFDMAVELSSDYKTDSDFVAFLEGLEYEKAQRVQKNVEAWVTTHGIEPKLKQGDKLSIKETISFHLKKDTVIYINGMRDKTACYIIDPDPERKGGYVYPYETIESKTTKL